jgi:hypothetical protein
VTPSSTGRLREATAVFEEVAKLSPEEAHAGLSALEGSDAELAALVRGLLKADQAAGSFWRADGDVERARGDFEEAVRLAGSRAGALAPAINRAREAREALRGVAAESGRPQ